MVAAGAVARFAFFRTLALASGAVFVACFFAGNDWRALLLALALLALFGWHELDVEFTRGMLQPSRVAITTIARSVASLVIGVLLVRLGFGAYGAVGGLVAGAALASAMSLPRWFSVRAGSTSTRALVRRMLVYGAPLTLSLALAAIVKSADRYLLVAISGAAEAGRYAAAYDIAYQALWALGLPVHMAAFPLALRALSTGGEAAAVNQLKRNGALLLAVVLPAASGLTALAPQIAETILGEEFRSSAALLLPTVAWAGVLSCVKSFYFDLGFQLSERTGLLLWPNLLGAVVNAVANLILIPTLGGQGAALATVIAFAVAVLASAIIVRRAFPMPLPIREFVKVAVAAGVMGAVVAWSGERYGLLLSIAVGALVYGAIAGIVNVAGLRDDVLRRLGWTAP